jgi:hypothetical protein
VLRYIIHHISMKMKVPISTRPVTGHNMTQPIAHELLITRSHSAVWITGPAYKTSVAATGATFIPFNTTCMFLPWPLSPGSQTVVDHGRGLASERSWYSMQSIGRAEVSLNFPTLAVQYFGHIRPSFVCVAFPRW